MKKSMLIFLLAIGVVACENSVKPTEPSEARLKSAAKEFTEDLIVGNWERTNNGGEERTFEFWQRSDSGVTGIGFTIVGEDTVFKEILEIVEAEGNRYYDVRGVNPDPTLFKFIEESESHFICVNDSNEFPKRIEYQFAEDSMTATISAGEKKVVFEFIKLK